MNHAILSRSSDTETPRAIVVFAGWGMDATPFEGLSRDGYDVIVVWDYRDNDMSVLPLRVYREICVVGWSFGVAEAARFMQKYGNELPVTRCIAVGGTLTPVDNQTGIPLEIFAGTLAGLDERNLTKFYRRMCGSAEAFERFDRHRPQRPIDELKNELSAIFGRQHPEPSAIELFDAVYVTADDRIIPADNQRRAWEGHYAVSELQSPHMPDFNLILANEFVAKSLMAENFAAGKRTYNDNAPAQHQIAEKLTALWRANSGTNAGRTLEIGVGPGGYTRRYMREMRPTSLTLWDIAPGSGEGLGVKVARVDGETAMAHITNGSLDSITSASAMQWFNSPARFLERCARSLAPGGMAVLSSYGPDNLRELIPYQESRLHYLGIDAIRRLALKAMPESQGSVELQEETITVEFADTRALIDHLRLTGVNAGANGAGMGAVRRLLSSGLKTLTYHPIYIIMKRRHR